MKILHLIVFVYWMTVMKASDELPDFEFDDHDAVNNEEYYYVTDGDDQQMQSSQTVVKYDKSPQLNSFLDDEFDDDVEMEDENTSTFKNKEEKMRSIMLKVFANKDLKRKFAEILPLLRVMSKTQKATLAALITAQVNSKDGHTLTLEQVKLMFGSRPDLILPLVYDIANMIRNVAQRESMIDVKLSENESTQKNQLLRRSFQVKPEPQGFRMNKMPEYNSNLKDSRLVIEDNDESQPITSNNKPTFEKLVQSFPRHHIQQAVAQPKQSDRMTYHERKLNMTAFNSTRMQRDQLAMPSDGPIPVTLHKSSPLKKENSANLTMEEIEDLALSGLNGTEVDSANKNNLTDENLPTPEMLIAGGRYNRPKGSNRKNYNPNEKCEYFSGGVCIKVENYPLTQIMGSIKRHRHAMSAILAEYVDKSDVRYYDDDESQFSSKLKKREDDSAKQPGGMCPSIVRYARPQKARSATGEWKYIVNTGHHTQTLRLEKCSTPQDSCTYLTDNFRSRCAQIYNYHRLLSWDASRGLHVDIFKVPTCCSCHIDGYRESFPPLTNVNNHNNDEYVINNNDDFSISASTNIRNTHYSTLKSEEEDVADDEDNIAYQFSNGFKRMPKPNKYENTVILTGAPSNKNRFERPKATTKKLPTFVPSPTLDSYLSPPPNEFSSNIPFKRGPQFSTESSLKRSSIHIQNPNPHQNRRPVRKQSADQSIAESDIRVNQVTVLPPKMERLPPTQAAEKNKKRTISTTTPKYREVSNKKVNVRLPNTVTMSSSPAPVKLDGNNKRINYSYHPIIDFFGEEEVPDVEAVDRIGLNGNRNHWKPMMNRPRLH